MKKQIPVWKTEYEWLKECYSQCLQSSVLNLSQAFINFFDGCAGYPTLKKRHGKQLEAMSDQNIMGVSLLLPLAVALELGSPH